MAAASRPSHAEAVEAVHVAGAAPDRWPETIGLLCDYLGAFGGTLAYHSLRTQTGSMVSGRLSEELAARYLSDYVDNPYSRTLMRVPPGRLAIANEIADVAAVRRTAFSADILEPYGIADIVMLPHLRFASRSSSGGIAFLLDRAQVEARDGVVERMGALAPHLVRAVDLSIELGAHPSEARQSADLLEALSNAALLIDGEARIVHANAAAEAILAEADGLVAVRVDGGSQLAAAHAAETRALRSLLGAAVAGGGRDAPGVLRVARPSGERTALFVTVTPLPPPPVPLWARLGRGARALVQIIDPHAPARRQANVLRFAVGLTAAEARVAALIAEGMTTPRVARALGLSPATVRTHLARCFDKTGTRSQVSLARLVTSLAGGG